MFHYHFFNRNQRFYINMPLSHCVLLVSGEQTRGRPGTVANMIQLLNWIYLFVTSGVYGYHTYMTYIVIYFKLVWI